MSQDTCRSCHRPMRWALTAKKRRIPLDPDPVPDGNVTLEEKVPGVLRATVHPVGAPLSGPRYVSHFATCPGAAQHRRGRR